MTFYSTSKTVCLRKRILQYFGEKFYAPCHHCSVCNGESRTDSYHIVMNDMKNADNQKLYVDEALLDRLKKKRISLALASGIPAFAVLSDASLREMAAYAPGKISELTRISGFGEAKINRYGKAFIDVINEYENEAEF